ncbi:ribosome maturation factor RimM [Desulfobacterales bacterium HSG16]|nr:ribosome maturation factor RimM [Desulfobacterales bacterium HSG16]
MDKIIFFSIGEIVGIHGVKGSVKILSHAESPEIFNEDHAFFFKDRENRRSPCKIEWAKPHKRVILAGIADIESREQAEKIIGHKILVDRAVLPEPEEGAYYWEDLVGLDVHTIDGLLLGKIVSIMETGANDVYVVRGEENEILIPALESVVKKIDIDEKIMEVDLPDGL